MLIKITIWTVYVCVASWIFASPVESERILALAPIAAQSHWNFMKGILRALTDRGHHVTVFTSFPENSRENYTVVDMSKELPTYLRLGVDDAKKQFGGSSHLIRSVSQWSRNSFQSIYDSDVMRKIRAAPTPGFDVVFVEIMASECVSYLSVELNVPLVYVSPPPLLSYVDRSVIGHHPNPAAVSDTISAYSIPRTFVQRFVNTLSLMYTYGLVQYYNTWNVNEADKRPFDRAVPAKPSIVFSNGHLTIDTARPLPPNVIQIGGIHLSAPRKIPKDILEFIDDSPNGVVLFSLGSLVSMTSLSSNVQKAIVEVLGRIPQRVLWKYEGEMEDKPSNVMTRKWFPQRDILLHPNVKLFIGHGGISGVYEVVDAGIPILGFPLIFDQERNLRHLEDAGMAIVMNIQSISSVEFSNAVSDLINDKKYMENAKITSRRFKDRPMSAEDTVDYWTKYVIRHKGAPHLKSQALNLTWYQYLLLDVIAVILLIFIFVVYILHMSVKMMYAYCASFSKLKSD